MTDGWPKLSPKNERKNNGTSSGWGQETKDKSGGRFKEQHYFFLNFL